MRPSPFCEATVTFVRATGLEEQQGWQEIECTLPRGHQGQHGDGYGFAWTDPWASLNGGSGTESDSALPHNAPSRGAS